MMKRTTTGLVLEAHQAGSRGRLRARSNGTAKLMRFRRRTRINLKTLIRLAVLCLIVVVILKLLKVI